MSEILLCADSMSVRSPEVLGLEGEPLCSFDWLDVLSSAHEARIRVRDHAPREVWVAGSDEVDAINLAATFKHDSAQAKVCLLAFSGSGSLMTRAQAAHIDEVWDKQTFLEQYRRAKSANSRTQSAGQSGLVSQVVPGVQAALDALAAPSVLVPTNAPAPVSESGPAASGLGSAAAAASGAPASLAMSAPSLSLASAPASGSSPATISMLQSGSPDGLAASNQAERGYLLSVLGAGGGVGKSSIAVVAAYIAQGKGYRTALVDADLQFGDVQYLTGRDDVLPLNEALKAPARLDALDCRGRQPAVLSAPVRLEYSEEVAGYMPELIERLRARFDVVVVNTSPAWSDLHLQLLEAGGNALFVLDQRPSSIRSCKHALQLCARCGVATQPIVFALNRCSRQSLFSSIDVACALQGAHVVELSEGGRDVEELLGTGAPVELVDSGNALCQSVARVLVDLLPKQAGAEAPTISMPSRKRSWFGSRRKKAACL